jgi:hypothetical protein
MMTTILSVANPSRLHKDTSVHAKVYKVYKCKTVYKIVVVVLREIRQCVSPSILRPGYSVPRLCCSL